MTIGGLLAGQKWLKQDAEQIATDLLYKLDGAKADITQLECLKCHEQADIDRFKAGRTAESRK